MILKEPINKEKFTDKLYFFAAARIGFEFLLRKIEFKNDEKILMPSYIGETDTEGSGVFDPVRKTGINYEFYRINRRLEADLEDIKRHLVTGKYKAIVIIHYFGFPQREISALSSLCKENGIILIEDCAHTVDSYLNGTKLGEFGDFSFYSIHKVIASEEGGILKINSNNFKNLLSGSGGIGQIKSESMEQFLRTDIKKTTEIRRHNYNLLLRLLTDFKKEIEILFPVLDEGVAPLNFPILIKNGKREAFYFKLKDKEVITCSLYYRLIKEIEECLFPISYEISRSILNLPVHQDTTDNDVCKIVETIRSILKEL